MAKVTDERKAQRVATRRRIEALAAEDEYQRNEAKRREWDTNDTRLTREELDSGVPCRGCGLPIIDGLGDRPPLVKLTAEERTQHEAADADHLTRHGNCRAHRWTISGSRTQHCGFCCPPPPLSTGQVDQISRLISSKSPRDHVLWRLTLTCDHTVERHQHRSNVSWRTHVVECPECGRHRGVVDRQRLPKPVVEEAYNRERRQTVLEADVTELTKLRSQAQVIKRRIETLERNVGAGEVN